MNYLLSNRQVEAGERFDAIAELFDAWTFRHFDDLGVAAGMRCWEVGAGGPTVPGRLARRVGPDGRVLATDIDVDTMVAGGHATDEELDHLLGVIAAGRLGLTLAPLISAWGVKPEPPE